MRRSLAQLSLATTALVVVSLLVPIGMLVRRQAVVRAQLDAERTAQSTASLVALGLALGSEPESLESSLGVLEEGVMVVLPSGARLGRPAPGQGSLVAAASRARSTVSDHVEGGWELAIPVIARQGTIVVDVFVAADRLTAGVASAWALLVLVGLILVLIATLLADRLGRRLVTPIAELAGAARRLGAGDLDARVHPAVQPELREVGESFNWLAARLTRLLAEEREAAADLSHRLRTPLTALRLQAEKLADPAERAQVVAQVDRLEQAIDQVIRAARAEREEERGVCELTSVVESRCAFWSVLAQEQERDFGLRLDGGPIPVAISGEAVEAVVDALVGNVFAHTRPGVAFTVEVGRDRELAFLEVSDQGPGFSSASALDRGVSGAGSTGLGLDIVRRTAELSGGGLQLDDRPGGGAVVRVWLGLAGA